MSWFHGVKLCITRGWDVNMIHMKKGSIIKTPLATAVHSAAMVTLLLERGATDVIHLDGIAEFSPALVHAIGTSNPNEEVIQLLLQHGSLVNSPYYTGGTLLLPAYALTSSEKHELLIKLLYDYGGRLDPIFPRPDGLIDTFVGESVEFLASSLESVKQAVAHGAKIKRPVEKDHFVRTLIKWGPVDYGCVWNYSSGNVFCAKTYRSQTGGLVNYDDYISFLKDQGADINALDCIIGYGNSEEILHLEYCTALEYFDFIRSSNVIPDRWPITSEEEIPLFGYPQEAVKKGDRYFGRVPREIEDMASILKKHGAVSFPLR
ncbi:hypothetical protein M422DRAFT_275877 [Sphaerobolus stellatus SS14]|uniref:Ankyrin repeat domain-containing protein n=1 Tax=Sphaerobolus stellatus (strain SS14) TaxID=990650 RepID=A0A0C9UEB5_SPHS4|nr:hypothetical protein M422DRAFT_275877 [Sphaerobolus stellatus SS14]